MSANSSLTRSDITELRCSVLSDEVSSRALDRFWRGGSSYEVSGVGLAIVKQFADIHQATTFVGASGTGGAMVGLDLAPTTTWSSAAHTVGTK